MCDIPILCVAWTLFTASVLKPDELHGTLSGLYDGRVFGESAIQYRPCIVIPDALNSYVTNCCLKYRLDSTEIQEFASKTLS